MIEEVESFGPELKIDAFSNFRVLQKGSVHVLESWAFQNIPACISKRARGRERKGRGVEPLQGCWIRQLGVSNQVRSIVEAESENGSSGSAVVDFREQCRREGPA